MLLLLMLHQQLIPDLMLSWLSDVPSMLLTCHFFANNKLSAAWHKLHLQHTLVVTCM